MYEIYNKLPQPINLFINNETVILKIYDKVEIPELNEQVKNLAKKNFIKIKEKK